MSDADKPIRIAMWSGPRNISTALMRSWGNRLDTLVIDEPFYAYYLKTTDKAHPGAEEVIANGETDWRKVVERLTGPIPDGKRILYQKQMTHHLLPEIDREWIVNLTNCFLIRDPRDVILSAEMAAQMQDINPDRIRYQLTSNGKIAHLLKHW